MRTEIRLLVTLLAAAVSVPAAHALPDDSGQPIDIQADHWDANRRTGVAVYRGNVRVTRGSVSITGDVLTLNYDGTRLAVADVQGSPVRFTQQHDEGRERTQAQASRLQYDAETGIVRLLGDARVSIDGDEFASDDIRYDMREERIVAGGGDGTRIQVTIQPRKPDEEPQP